MASTYAQLHERLAAAFGALVPGADPALRVSDHADYQANGVMGLAKQLGRNPREVATEVLGHLDIDDLAEVQVAGPGFLNLRLRATFVAAQLGQLAEDERLGVARDVPRRVVIDYSAPNVAKEMHVGHLRSTVIGDALARLHRFVGHEVIAPNHVGDWGTPFGMLIEHLVDLGEDRALASLSIGDLDGFYREARAAFDRSEEFRERSRLRVVALQGGDEETRRLWRILVEQSMLYFSQVYDLLGVTLTREDVVGESAYNELLGDVVADLSAAGLLVESDGALCAFPAGFVNREGEPLPLIVQKRDEGYGYAATDLAALRQRVGELGAAELLYVVGAPQAQHFDMVFAVARAAGWLDEDVRCEHVAFGSILGADRKMLRTRAGSSVKLVGLLQEATARADAALRERDAQLSDEQRVELSLVIARGAIKWADLSTERQRDYVFDLERMLSFEGDTGPYLQYAHARQRSILRRAEDSWSSQDVAFALVEPAERDLALGLLGLPEAVASAIGASQPHRLCTYLFDLAQRFTAFYEACPVLGAPAPTRDERLALCEISACTLALGLSLLGIEAPERM